MFEKPKPGERFVHDPMKGDYIEPDPEFIRKHNPKQYRKPISDPSKSGLQEVDGIIIHFIGGSSCKIDRMSVDHLVDFIERQSNKRRELGEDGPNLIRIEGGPFFQLKNVTYVEPWEHTEMVIDMEDKNEK